MPEVNADPDSLLAHASQLEKDYDWGEAAALYDKASSLTGGEDWLAFGRIREARAKALYMHSFQAENSTDFLERLALARAEYLKAKDAFLKVGKEVSLPWVLRCDAMVAYIDYWKSTSVDEKKELINKSLSLAEESMDAFEVNGQAMEFARTSNLFTFAVQLAYTRSDDFAERDRLVRDALAYSEKGAAYVNDTFDRDDAARSFFNVFRFRSVIASQHSDVSEREKQTLIAREWWMKSFERSREAALYEWNTVILGGAAPFLTEEERDRMVDELLQMSRRMQDRLFSGLLFDWISFREVISSHSVEDGELRNSLIDDALTHSSKAAEEFSVISFVMPTLGPIWPHALNSSYMMWKAIFESDLSQKKRYAEEGLQAWPEELSIARDSGYPFAVAGAYWDVIRLLNALAMTQKDKVEKRRTLESSADYINKYIEWADRLYPYDILRDFVRSFLGDTEYQLYEVAIDSEEKIRRLRSAIRHKYEDLEAYESESLLLRSYDSLAGMWFGSTLYLCGKWSMLLYELTADRSEVSAALDAFDKSASHFMKAGLPNRCAESRWQEAITQSVLGDHKKAASAFSNASKSYAEASENTPRLREFFKDYESYMKAWSEVEVAKHHHSRQEPRIAKKHFEAASAHLARTRKWSYLTSDISAWAKLENAEELSKRDLGEKAAAEFATAAEQFANSVAELKTALPKISDSAEQSAAESLVKASRSRTAYCTARILLEEARLLDKGGDEAESSEKYAAAVRSFQQIHEDLDSEQDRQDVALIITLAKAWQAMTKAEAEASADLYGEAAKLFDEAKDLVLGKREKLMMTGHSHFCKALEAGTQFADAGEVTLHCAAIQHLDSAANYYLKADNGRASEYANASKLLLDAYLYMGKAGREESPEKTAKLYAMSEKLLGASAASFEKAGYPARRAELTRLLAKVKRDKELAISLSETFRAPEVASATTVLSAPTPTLGTATGLDGFEYANIQATLIAQPRNLLVGENMQLEIELVNAGRASAQLTKVEGFVPQGFEVVEKPSSYRFEDSHLNLRGRRLDALKTEDVRLILKPVIHGRFTLRPRIMYLDESGKYKSHEPEPVEVTVKEMGISGWLKGPDRR